MADSNKRRRIGTVDLDYAYVANPTTSRTKAQAAMRRTNEEDHSRRQQTTTASQVQNQTTQGPILSFASLPPTALQRYLVRYGLLENQGSLSYHHSVFPVPPLPATLYPPLDGRSLNSRIAKQTYDPSRRRTTQPSPPREDGSKAAGEEAASGSGEQERDMLQRPWREPKTEEFAELTSFDDPKLAIERLAKRATMHWDKRDSVKEGETLTNFM
ncbi:hypothetical protein JCM5353_001935 [Sporobolomyces roseus]